jgi:chemotaxis protein MotB
MAENGTVIIKRFKKGGHGAAHGGAWKVAYADFVTAMMAFFLLLWLINTTTPEQKRGIADYFAAQNISQSTSGAGGILGGKVLSQQDARAGGTASVYEKAPPQQPTEPTQAAANPQHGGASAAGSQAAATQMRSDDRLEHTAISNHDEAFDSAAEAIHQAMQEEPDIADLSRQVVVDQTPEGLRIQLVDEDGRPMFQLGSSQPLPYTSKILAVIARVIDRLPNRISIRGHTAGKAAESGSGSSSNWELSAGRANAARAIVTRAGVENDRIYEVAGKAGSDPLLPEDPAASANRRLSITLLREAPPVPPDHRL